MRNLPTTVKLQNLRHDIRTALYGQIHDYTGPVLTNEVFSAFSNMNVFTAPLSNQLADKLGWGEPSW